MAQLISTALRTLFTGDSLELNGTSAVKFRLLDWGRGRAIVATRREAAQQAYIDYQATVLGGLRDVEDALAQLDAERTATPPSNAPSPTPPPPRTPVRHSIAPASSRRTSRSTRKCRCCPRADSWR